MASRESGKITVDLSSRKCITVALYKHSIIVLIFPQISKIQLSIKGTAQSITF